ncbi:MAG: hypothetical protein A2X49_10985 [Lentisphaerae bacterium GWF2_52_8]|nr:MAG: hypothetical protein A2X49_10985 [Lentisphaerae bacterium GWF2_52_8]
MATLIKDELMEILVCPLDKQKLIELVEEKKLECSACGRRYPVREGIPVMLLDEAELPDEKTTGKDISA